MAQLSRPPEQLLEWVFMFPSGRPASAILRTNDLDEVDAWAKGWPGTIELHRRIVMIGNWIPYSQAVAIDLPQGRRSAVELPRQLRPPA